MPFSIDINTKKALEECPEIDAFYSFPQSGIDTEGRIDTEGTITMLDRANFQLHSYHHCWWIYTANEREPTWRAQNVSCHAYLWPLLKRITYHLTVLTFIVCYVSARIQARRCGWFHLPSTKLCFWCSFGLVKYLCFIPQANSCAECRQFSCRIHFVTCRNSIKKYFNFRSAHICQDFSFSN